MRTSRNLRGIAVTLATIVVGSLALAAVPAQAATPCPDHVTIVQHPDFQHTGNLVVSPPSLELVLTPGAVIHQCVIVSNRADIALPVTLTTIDATASSDPKKVVDFRSGAKYGLSSWISFPTVSVQAQPGADITIPFTLQVPQAPPAGTNAGAIVVRRGRETQGQTLSLQTQALLQVFVTMANTTHTGGDVVQVRSPHVVHHGDQPHFSFVFRNRGNTIEHVNAKVDIGSSFGNRARTLGFDAGRVYRDGQRPFDATWNDVPWIGLYHPTLVVKADGGTRTIHLPSVWVLPPWWFVVALVIAILAPLFLWWRRRRRELERYMAEDELLHADDAP